VSKASLTMEGDLSIDWQRKD